MNENPTDRTEMEALEASLERLGIRELEERMEVSPLVMELNSDPNAPNDVDICCVCKIPNPFGPGDKIPYPTIVPTPTGPTLPEIPDTPFT